MLMTTFYKKDQKISKIILLKWNGEALGPFLETKLAKTKIMFMASSLFLRKPRLFLNVMVVYGRMKIIIDFVYLNS